MKSYDKAPSGAVDRARDLRRNSTEAEKLFWRKLRENFPNTKFRRQSPVGPYIADFLSHRHKLIIEVDGGQHVEQTAADAARTRFLESEGFTVIRFWNNEVLENCDGVLQAITAKLSDS